MPETILWYLGGGLEARLETLDAAAPAVFAVSCAARLLRQVSSEPGKYPEAAHAVALAWSILLGDSGRAVSTSLQRLEELGSDLDADVNAAAFYALTCAVNQDVQSAVFAARRVLEAAWDRETGNESRTFDAIDVDAATAPVQAEHAAQQDELDILAEYQVETAIGLLRQGRTQNL